MGLKPKKYLWWFISRFRGTFALSWKSCPWCLLFLLLFCVSGFAAQRDWWNTSWHYRRKFSLFSVSSRPTGNTAYAELVTGNNLQADGFDLRVVDNRNVLTPYKVLFSDPSGISFIAFKCDEKYEPYTFYFGYSPGEVAQSPADEWDPKGGLILREWASPSGIANSWEDMQNIFAGKGKQLSASLRRNIYDSYSPYSYSGPHISLYEGYLLVNKDGRYKLSVSSDGPVFLLIDGNMAFQWPGGHNASWQGDHSGLVELEKGQHRFELYWQALWGMDAQKIAACCLTDWNNPSRKYNYYQPIPRERFLDSYRTDAGALENYGRDWCADFGFRQSSFLPSDFGFMIQYNFYAVEREGHLYGWDFGDGTTAEGPVVDHVFITPGKYRVTMRETGEDGVDGIFAVSVFTVCEPRLSDYNFKARLNNYRRIIAEYSLERFKFNELLVIWDLARQSEDPVLLLRVGNKLLPYLLTELRSWQRNLNILKLCTRVAESLSGDDSASYELAKDLCKEVVDEIYPDKERKEVRRPIIDANMMLADLYLHKIKDYDRAINEYVRMLDYRISYSENLRIMTGMGDAWLFKGEIAKAAEYYKKVSVEKDYSYEQETALEGGIAQQIDAYLQLKDMEGAKTSLADWDESIPWKKLEPYYWLLRGRYFFQAKKYSDALFSLDMALKLSVEVRGSIPEILYYKRRCFLALNDSANASSVLDQLKLSYPDSPWLK